MNTKVPKFIGILVIILGMVLVFFILFFAAKLTLTPGSGWDYVPMTVISFISLIVFGITFFSGSYIYKDCLKHKFITIILVIISLITFSGSYWFILGYGLQIVPIYQCGSTMGPNGPVNWCEWATGLIVG